jgi:hypothetical protein
MPLLVTLRLRFSLPQDESYQSEDELMVGLTEEQKLQKQLDAKNITVKLSVRGDGANFPVSIKSFTHRNQRTALGYFASSILFFHNLRHFPLHR